MKKIKKEFGKHYVVEFIGCDPSKLKRVQDIKPILLKAAKVSQATVIKYFFHQYKPYGVTGIILIAESHFSIHTWPEDAYVAFDILTCGKMFPLKAIEYIQESLASQKVKIKVLSRGF